MCIRDSTKNLLLRLLLAGSAGALLLYPLGRSLPFFLVVASLYSFLQCSVSPLGETIALEYLTGHGLHFGKVRVFGTIGYCLAVFLCGFLFTGENNNYGLIFPISAAGYLIVVAATSGLPKVRGHRRRCLLYTSSDVGSAVMTLLGFKIAAKPADSGHPFGHGRAEYISCLLYTSRCV